MAMRYDIEAAMLASERAARILHRKMGRGHASLAAIASSAPLVGLFGTVFGIVTSFVGCGGEKSTCMAAVVKNLSEAIWATAAGLLVAIFALWSYRYLCAQLEALDTEMRAATLELANLLGYGH
jgi:biopolymer transport protein ExbB/TolQ